MSHHFNGLPDQPRNILSPITGDTIRPVIREVRVGDEIRTEAHYICPSSNQFVTKLILKSTKLDGKPKP